MEALHMVMNHACRRRCQLYPELFLQQASTFCQRPLGFFAQQQAASGQGLRSVGRRKSSTWTGRTCRVSHHHHDNHHYQRQGQLRCSSGQPSANNDEDEEESQALQPPPSCLLPYLGLKTHPDEVELKPGQRLVAIGDVHGDFRQLLHALAIAGVVAEEEPVDEDEGRSFVWTGGDYTILVQMGDILDRGPHELQCWQLLVGLARQAHAMGGKVIKLFGNHELWTSIGFYQLDEERYLENLDYEDDIHDAFEMEFGQYLDQALVDAQDNTNWRDERVLNHLVTNGTVLSPWKVAARWAAMEPGGLLAKDFLAHFKIAVKVGNTVLVHAGMVPEHLDRFGGIRGMNDATRNWILKRGPRAGRQHMCVPTKDPEGRFRTYVQSMPDFFLEGDDNAYSPIWMRDYGDPPDEVPPNQQTRDMLVTVLQRLNADRMVIGHTRQSQINAILNGKAWRIDVGMSQGMDGTCPEVLEITKGEDGTETVSVLTAAGKVSAEERYLIEAHAGT